MPKFLTLSFFTIIISTFYLLDLQKDIHKSLLDINHKIKEIYIQKQTLVENFFLQYSNQANTIEKLQKQVLINKVNSIPLLNLQQEIKSLKNFNSKYILKDNIAVTRVLHFKNLTDYLKIWIDLKKKDNSINGLINHDMAAGIVKLENSKSLALLNQDEKCNYGVFIGKTKAIGITHGMRYSPNILVKFIPLWNTIKVNDEVITNGLDHIFFEGLKVGRVIQINKKINYLEAIVKPYDSATAKKYYTVYIAPPTT
jgi:rod shape-determining protein MreC